MTHIRYPRPLRKGDIIGITAPSAGFGPELEQRYQYCLQTLSHIGYRINEGNCLRSNAMVSAPAKDRAVELTSMLLDDSIAAVIPPWGGELLVGILPELDFTRLALAAPKWIMGYSDLSTFMLPYTLLTQIATAHGSNLMEVPIRPDSANLAYWNDILTLPSESTFTQTPSTRYQIQGPDWRLFPTADAFHCTETTTWRCLQHEDDASYEVHATGRLIGGCLDVLAFLLGSPYAAIQQHINEFAPEGILLYLENVDGNSAEFCRMLHAFMLAGWIQHANAVLIGRTPGHPLREFTMHDALIDAMAGQKIPVIYDMDIGHVPPQMILINGALATLKFGRSGHTLVQTLV